MVTDVNMTHKALWNFFLFVFLHIYHTLKIQIIKHILISHKMYASKYKMQLMI